MPENIPNPETSATPEDTHMTADLHNQDAESRDGLVCPECLTTGLAPPPEDADNTSGGSIIHNTTCRSEKCKYHPTNPGPDTIPGRLIEPQLADSGGLTSRTSGGSPKKFLTILLTLSVGVALVWVLVINPAANPLTDNGSTPIVETEEYNFNPTSTAGNWTIYQYNNSKMVVGSLNSDLVYLNRTGHISSRPVTFNNTTAADKAVFTWQARSGELQQTVSPDNTDTDPLSLSPLSLFANNNSYLVAGNSKGQTVFLTSNQTISEQPYRYSTTEQATQSYFQYINQHSLKQTADGTELIPATEANVSVALEGDDR